MAEGRRENIYRAYFSSSVFDILGLIISSYLAYTLNFCERVFYFSQNQIQFYSNRFQRLGRSEFLKLPDSIPLFPFFP